MKERKKTIEDRGQKEIDMNKKTMSYNGQKIKRLSEIEDKISFHCNAI